MSLYPELPGDIPSKNIQQIYMRLKRASFIGFWMQLVLGVVSGVIWLVCVPIIFQPDKRTPGSEVGIVSAFVALVILLIAIILFFRYGKIATRIASPDPARRPKRSETIKIIRFGLIINVAGMVLAIVGAQALVGLALIKSLSTASPQLIGPNITEFVNSFDLLIILANTNSITAHFAGIVTSLWLLDRLTK